MTAVDKAFDFIEMSLLLQPKETSTTSQENLNTIISKQKGFHFCFKDGRILCKLINIYAPGAIPKISQKDFPFLQIENLNMFIAACHGFGVGPQELFDAFDFYDGNNVDRAVECVLALERQVRAGERFSLDKRFKGNQQQLISRSQSNIVKKSSTQNLQNIQKSHQQQPQSRHGSDPSMLLKKSVNSLASPETINQYQTTTTNDISPSPSSSSTYQITSASPADFTFTLKQEQTESNLKAVVKFIEQTLGGDPMPSPDLFESLRDGVILCRLMNAIQPGSIPTSTIVTQQKQKKQHPYQLMQNIYNFLRSARDYGVKQSELFQTSDLYEGRDMAQVVVTLTALARIYYSTHSSNSRKHRTEATQAQPLKKSDETGDVAGDGEISNRSSDQGRKTSSKQQQQQPRLKSDGKYLMMDDQRVHGMIIQITRHSTPVSYNQPQTGVNEIVFGQCLGRGQFGAVFKGLNLTTGETVAIKRVYMNDAANLKEATTIMKEVDLMKSLQHQNIVRFEGSLQQDGFLNIVMEYVENGSLYQQLKQFGPFPERLVAIYTYGILEGLQFLHSRQVVHCDLKAANILTTKTGQIKLIDFGISKNFEFAMEGGAVSGVGDVAGTPNWMSPEVIELRGAQSASDIWSLGCTIIELITGKPPHADLNPMTVLFKIVEDEMPIPDGISPELKDFLQFCFIKDVDRRPSSQILLHHNWLTKLVRLQQQQKNSLDIGDRLSVRKASGTTLASTRSMPETSLKSSQSLSASGSQSRPSNNSKSPHLEKKSKGQHKKSKSKNRINQQSNQQQPQQQKKDECTIS